MIVTHKRFGRLISPKRLSSLGGSFYRKGIVLILAGRHLVGLRVQIFLAAGVMRMSAAHFLIADAISSIFTIALMVGAGYMGGHSLQVISKDITRIEHVGIALIIVLFVGYVFLRWFASKRTTQ